MKSSITIDKETLFKIKIAKARLEEKINCKLDWNGFLKK